MTIEDGQARWLALLLLGVLLAAIAIYGWRSAPASIVNRLFAVQTLIVTVWVIGVAGAHSGQAMNFWGGWAFAAAALMPAAFLRFAEAFPTEEYKLPSVAIRTVYILAALLAVLSVSTPWIAHDYRFSPVGTLMRTPGPLMPAFIAFYVVACGLIFLVLAKKWRSARGLPRAQLRLYSIGLLLFCVGGVITNIALPAFVGDSRYSALGPCFVLVFLAFVAHGIIRHRLMNIRLVLHKWLAMSIASLASIGPLLIIATHLEPSTQRSAARGSLMSVGLLLLAGLLAPPLWIGTRRLTQRYLYRGYADFPALITDASERLSQVLTSLDTASVVTDIIVSAVDPDGVAVYLSTREPHALDRVHARVVGNTFGSPDILPSALASKLKGPLLGSLQAVPVDTREPSEAISRIFEDNQWALVVPLIAEGEVLGALAVGIKRSGAPYYIEDVRLLKVVAGQASVAFKNGQLYERVVLANQHIENIVATVESGIVTVDDKHIVRVMNQAALSLLGISTPGALPVVMKLSDLPAALSAALSDTLALGRPVRTAEMMFSAQAGDLVAVCYATPLRSANGGIIGAVAALNDLSTLKALEVERTRAERLDYFEALAAALAHEIANPIAPIKVMTQLLGTRYRDPAFISDFTRTVTREIVRIEKLVDRLRALSRPALRQARPTDVREPLQDAIEVMRSTLETHQISLTARISEDALVVSGDESELHELFLNLLTNAVEATPPEGHIAIDAWQSDASACVRITDSGCGIPTGIAGAIFQPFVSSKQRGSGLGLAICDGIVKRHHGSITAASAATGAQFTVCVPVVGSETAARREPRDVRP